MRKSYYKESRNAGVIVEDTQRIPAILFLLSCIPHRNSSSSREDQPHSRSGGCRREPGLFQTSLSWTEVKKSIMVVPPRFHGNGIPTRSPRSRRTLRTEVSNPIGRASRQQSGHRMAGASRARMRGPARFLGLRRGRPISVELLRNWKSPNFAHGARRASCRRVRSSGTRCSTRREQPRERKKG